MRPGDEQQGRGDGQPAADDQPLAQAGIAQQHDEGLDQGVEHAGQPQQDAHLEVGQSQVGAQGGQGRAFDAVVQLIEEFDQQEQKSQRDAAA